MEFPMRSEKDMERSFELLLRARKAPSVETWDALAFYEYGQMFGFNPPGDEMLGTMLLHALVEVSWEAWKKDPNRCRKGLLVGLGDHEGKGIPPFLNRNLSRSHVELVLLHERVGPLCLSTNAYSLGNLLLTFHILEAFIRPGTVMATFLMDVTAGKKVKVEKVLKRGWKIASFYWIKEKLEIAINNLRENGMDFEFLKVFDEFLESVKDEDVGDLDDGEIERRVALEGIRNAIAHHDFDIIDGTAKLNWMWHAKNTKQGLIDKVEPEDLQSNLNKLRGCVTTYAAWVIMLGGVFAHRKIPEDINRTDLIELAKNWFIWVNLNGPPME
jgi:hypothetical protein